MSNYRKNYLATGRSIPKGWHLHHIIPRCHGGTDDASNLVCVHPSMHHWVHKMRGDKVADNFLIMSTPPLNNFNRGTDRSESQKASDKRNIESGNLAHSGEYIKNRQNRPWKVPSAKTKPHVIELWKMLDQVFDWWLENGHKKYGGSYSSCAKNFGFEVTLTWNNMLKYCKSSGDPRNDKEWLTLSL